MSQGCRAWWDVWIQFQSMGLESHIGSIGLKNGVYKAWGSPTTITSFCDVILPRFLSDSSNNTVYIEKENHKEPIY